MTTVLLTLTVYLALEALALLSILLLVKRRPYLLDILKRRVRNFFDVSEGSRLSELENRYELTIDAIAKLQVRTNNLKIRTKRLNKVLELGAPKKLKCVYPGSR